MTTFSDPMNKNIIKLKKNMPQWNMPFIKNLQKFFFKWWKLIKWFGFKNLTNFVLLYYKLYLMHWIQRHKSTTNIYKLKVANLDKQTWIDLNNTIIILVYDNILILSKYHIRAFVMEGNILKIILKKKKRMMVPFKGPGISENMTIAIPRGSI